MIQVSICMVTCSPQLCSVAWELKKKKKGQSHAKTQLKALLMFSTLNKSLYCLCIIIWKSVQQKICSPSSALRIVLLQGQIRIIQSRMLYNPSINILQKLEDLQQWMQQKPSEKKGWSENSGKLNGARSFSHGSLTTTSPKYNFCQVFLATPSPSHDLKTLGIYTCNRGSRHRIHPVPCLS